MGVLEDLATQLGVPASTLRASLLANEQAEALQPTYLTTDAAGRVSANFSGHVKASGIELDAGPVSAVSILQEVAWLRDTDNVEVGYVRVWQDNAGLRVCQFFAKNDAGPNRSGFEASQYPPGVAGNIGAAYVWANGNRYTIIRDDGFSDFVLSTPEALHLVGAAGEPAFQNAWINRVGSGSNNPAGFYKDSMGRVYVQGEISSGTNTSAITIFTLPAGYRPSGVRQIPIVGWNETLVATVQADGQVKLSTYSGAALTNTGIYLDGINFRL